MDFRRLVAPVFIAVAASIAAFVAVVIGAALLQDDAALEAEAKVIAQDLTSTHQALAVLAEDNAWWDESVVNITVKEDVSWIDATIGESVTGIQNIQGVLILRADGSLIYSNFVENLPAPYVFLDAGLAALVRGFPESPDGSAVSTSGFLMAGDQLIAYGASRVLSSGIMDLPPAYLEAKGAVIIFLTRLTTDRIDTLGQANAINGLHFAPDTMDKASLVPVEDVNGNILTYLAWETAAPGSKMISKMILPAAFLLLVVIVAMGRFVKQANTLVQELESANKAKSAFLASTSHEIRTPLNAIIGFTELISLELYGKVEGEKNREYLTLIKESGEHLLSIINDILDISKLEAERFDIYAEKVDPLLVVEASRKIVQAQANEKNIEITADCEPAALYSDERIMRQILINLLSNAVKFTKSGGQITVSGKPVGERYQLVVKDSGIGMTEEELDKALSLFGQVQSEFARNHTGTGLGLPLVTRFMELLGGDFAISSTPGEGTTVTLAFPLYGAKKA